MLNASRLTIVNAVYLGLTRSPPEGRRLFKGKVRSARFILHGRNPSPTIKTGAPVPIGEVGNHHSIGAAAGGMNKPVSTQINTDMRKRPIEGIKKNQVARKEFGLGQWLRGFADRQALAREHHAGNLFENMADEAAAVESRLGRDATQSIGRADQADSVERNIVSGGARMS